MDKILVSILSDHLIPNYQVYKRFKSEINRHLIICSKQMKVSGVFENFSKAIGSEFPIDEVVLDDVNDYEKMYLSIQDFILNYSSGEEFIVNLTGGNKLMTICDFNLFNDLNAKMLYVGIGSNSMQYIFPNKSKENFNENLTVSEYLNLYGLNIEYNNECVKTKEDTYMLFDQVAQKNYNALSIRDIRDSFETKEDTPIGRYYRGTWFEEYMYHLIKSTIGLTDNEIAMNVRVKRDASQIGDDNEYDIVFVSNNKLYVVECKSSVGKRNERKIKIEPMLYKLAASVKDMGIQVTPILAVLAELKYERKRWMQKRSDILNIRTLGVEEFEKEVLLKLFIKNLD